MMRGEYNVVGSTFCTGRMIHWLPQLFAFSHRQYLQIRTEQYGVCCLFAENFQLNVTFCLLVLITRRDTNSELF